MPQSMRGQSEIDAEAAAELLSSSSTIYHDGFSIIPTRVQQVSPDCRVDPPPRRLRDPAFLGFPDPYGSGPSAPSPPSTTGDVFLPPQQIPHDPCYRPAPSPLHVPPNLPHYSDPVAAWRSGISDHDMQNSSSVQYQSGARHGAAGHLNLTDRGLRHDTPPSSFSTSTTSGYTRPTMRHTKWGKLEDEPQVSY
jgi:hypothetical protein